jgi:hypothetical protein
LDAQQFALAKAKATATGSVTSLIRLGKLWLLAFGIQASIDAAFSHCRFMTTEGIAGKSHRLAGAGAH